MPAEWSRRLRRLVQGSDSWPAASARGACSLMLEVLTAVEATGSPPDPDSATSPVAPDTPMQRHKQVQPQHGAGDAVHRGFNDRLSNNLFYKQPTALTGTGAVASSPLTTGNGFAASTDTGGVHPHRRDGQQMSAASACLVRMEKAMPRALHRRTKVGRHDAAGRLTALTV